MIQFEKEATSGRGLVGEFQGRELLREGSENEGEIIHKGKLVFSFVLRM